MQNHVQYNVMLDVIKIMKIFYNNAQLLLTHFNYNLTSHKTIIFLYITVFSRRSLLIQVNL